MNIEITLPGGAEFALDQEQYRYGQRFGLQGRRDEEAVQAGRSGNPDSVVRSAKVQHRRLRSEIATE
jgi:hypothetical protein